MIPTLRTSRLVLSPFTLDDALEVQRLAGDAQIAATTVNIPHPYPDGAAERWIARHQTEFFEGHGVVFAIREPRGGAIMGAIGLVIDDDNRRAELGYWIGAPFWRRGICTEAARRVLEYAFTELGLHRIHAHHLAFNVASGRVMQKIGMKREGVLRQHHLKDGVFHDAVIYSILKDEF